MSNPVQVYVYDLSDGIARQVSLMLTGRQIDGVWHTSVVVFGKEIFYGHGIIVTPPGKSHHGSPLRVINMGETAIDEETFEDYLATMRENYTAEKYHLLDFNCNSFTNDCLEFLTGSSLPPYIKALPSDFLSTSFGRALRPTIDAMFEGRTPVYAPPPNLAAPESTTGLSSDQAEEAAQELLQSINTRVAADSNSSSFVSGVSSAPVAPVSVPPAAPAPIPALQPAPVPNVPLTSSTQIITNPASFQSLLRSNRAVVAFFTSATCGPCRMIEPVFEELARTKSRPSGGVGFAKIDLSVGMGGALASEHQVRATPTFVFFLDGKKMNVLLGVNAPELKTQVDLLIYEAFPPHAHTSLSLPAVEAISLNPILFSQIPNLDTMFSKFAEFIGGVKSWVGETTQEQVIQTLFETVLPFLKTSAAAASSKPANFEAWPAITLSLAENLVTDSLYPLVDIWRLALLSPMFAAWSATKKVSNSPIQCLMNKALDAKDLPRNYLLILLRMLSNAFSNEVLAREMILSAREGVTKLLVDALLHSDVLVRTAAASLAFNIAAYLQKRRVDKFKAQDDTPGLEENEDWEIELVVAIIGGIEREMKGEDTVHRLVACLALMLRLSPYVEQVMALLEALQAREVLKAKLSAGGFGDARVAEAGFRSAEGGIAKKEVRKLILEVAEKLCPT